MFFPLVLPCLIKTPKKISVFDIGFTGDSLASRQPMMTFLHSVKRQRRANVWIAPHSALLEIRQAQHGSGELLKGDYRGGCSHDFGVIVSQKSGMS